MELFFITPPTSFTPSSTPFNVYLSSANGDDANDGLDPTTPVATFSRVWELLPYLQTQPFVVHVDGGDATTLATTYTFTPPPKNLQLGASAFIVIYGDGAGQGTNDGFYEVTTGTVTGASTSVALVVTGGGLGVNAYRGMTVEMLDGVAAGHRKTIVENDATTLYPVASFSNAASSTITPGNGDSFRVVRPNVLLDFAASGQIAPVGCNIHFVNIRQTDYAALDSFPTLVSSSSLFYGFECSDLGIGLEESTIYAGMGAYDGTVSLRPTFVQITYPLLLSALGNPVTVLSGAWDGWGMGSRAANFGGIYSLSMGVGVGSSVFGYFVVPQIVASGSRSMVNLVGYNLYGSGGVGLRIEDGASASLDSFSLDYAKCRCRMSGVLIKTGGEVNVGLFNATPLFLDIPANGNGILCDAGSFRIDAALTSVAAGTGKHFSLQNRSVVKISGATSLTGATCDFGTLETGSSLVFRGAVTFNGAVGPSLATNSYLNLAGAASHSFTATGIALQCVTGSQVDVNFTTSFTGSDANGAVQIRDLGSILRHPQGTLTVVNSSVAANAPSVSLSVGAGLTGLGGGSEDFTCASASGYGLRCRGTGTFAVFGGQPTGIVGTTNDLLVDATAFADGALAAAYSSVTDTSGARIGRYA